MNHQFSVEVAVDIGLAPAIIFNSIGFWVEQNAANGRNLRDGRYWTYNTVKAWTDLFPYLTQKKVEKALSALREHGYVMAANYNEDRRDRTLWYTLTDKGHAIFHPSLPQGRSISPTGEMEVPHRGNDYIYSTVDNTVSNTDISSEKSPDTFESDLAEIVDFLNSTVGSRYTTKNKQLRGYVRARLSEGFTVEDFRTVISTKAAKWKDDPKMRDYLRPSTLFAPSHFEEYLNESPKPKSILDSVDWSKYELESV